MDDVDEAPTRAVAVGAAERVPPADIQVGRCSVLADPAGAGFTLFRSASPG